MGCRLVPSCTGKWLLPGLSRNQSASFFLLIPPSDDPSVRRIGLASDTPGRVERSHATANDRGISINDGSRNPFHSGRRHYPFEGSQLGSERVNNLPPACLRKAASVAESERMAVHLHPRLGPLMDAVVMKRVPNPGWSQECGASPPRAPHRELEYLIHEL